LETIEKKPISTHRDQKTGSFEHCPVQYASLGGVTTLVTAIECDNPIAEIHFIKGFKSSPLLYEDLMEDLMENNINIILVSLPNPLDEIDFFEDYEKIAKAVYLDGELDDITSGTLPLIAANHSTGGFLMTKLLMDEDKAERINQRYTGAIFASPFYGSAYHRNTILAPFTKLYSKIFSRHAVGTTWLERQFTRAAAPLQSEDYLKSMANHRQALYMDGPTSELVRDIHAQGFPDILKDIKPTFLLGKKDKVSYNALSHSVAKIMGATIKELNGGHSQIRKSEQGRNFLINYIKDLVNAPAAPTLSIQRPAPANDDHKDAPQKQNPPEIPAGPA
tara:strand:- start:2475 stop:3476 length:1002 start_codon:yes stop_codon:yes gene_type:complete